MLDSCFSFLVLFFRKPNAMKQRNAFPPNFIHSLDSCHMMLTAIYCLRLVGTRGLHISTLKLLLQGHSEEKYASRLVQLINVTLDKENIIIKLGLFPHHTPPNTEHFVTGSIWFGTGLGSPLSLCMTATGRILPMCQQWTGWERSLCLLDENQSALCNEHLL